MILTGSCHCGNLRIRFETALTPAALRLRACQCTFCRARGVLSASDPAGGVEVSAVDGAFVQRYRFGLGITDYLICRCCGVYMLALAEIEGARYAVINANVLARRAELDGPVQSMDYDGETVVVRQARRKTRWTPVGTLTGF